MYYRTFSKTNRAAFFICIGLSIFLGVALFSWSSTLLAQETVTTDPVLSGSVEQNNDTQLTQDAGDTLENTQAQESTTPAEGGDPSTSTTIDTGDANALLESETYTNTNSTSVNENTASEENTFQNEADTDTLQEGNTGDMSTNNTEETLNTSETTVTNENTAQVDLTAGVQADTGNNSAVGNSTVDITTGNAISTANVVNVVNTNLFNSTGLFYFLNLLMGNMSIDLRNIFSILTGGDGVQSSCNSEDPCAPGDTTVTIQNTNSATVQNTLEVVANTGSNTAGASGDASVTTGNAYASANVVNLVNTNITDTNYLLMTVNNFDAGKGGVIFPAAKWFNDLLAQAMGSAQGSQTTVENTNVATVTNNGLAVADTGGNMADGDGSTITTGDATTQTSVVNKVNTNIFGDSISFLFNIQGSWAGEVFGLPDGMTWRETPTGIEIYFDNNGALDVAAGSTDNLSVSNNNTADVTNNVSVFALTGENKVGSESGEATIETGDAKASASIVNVVNTNVLGRNWVLAIFNIFGDWDGNISFGQPDLWIGVRALVNPNNVRPGSCFEYEYTIHNFGDADAHNIFLYSNHSDLQQSIERMDKNSNGRMNYFVGDIDAGGSTTFTLPTCISPRVQPNTSIETIFQVLPAEEDADYANNKESVGILTKSPGGGSLMLPIKEADFTITKTVDRKTIAASSSVVYEITIENGENPIYNALLVDTIFDEDRNPVHEQRWGLGTILKDETIVVSYESFFNGSTSPGIYTNEAFISGTTRDPVFEKDVNDPIESPVASVDIKVIENVLGEHTCSPLLTSYIKPNERNNADEVGELQLFLKTFEGFDTVSITKQYDQESIDAVRAFQERYAADILEPWGLSEGSGYVYYTTQKKINELWCKDLAFPLSETQTNEIETFKNRSKNYVERKTATPTQQPEISSSNTRKPEENTLAIEVSEPAIVREVAEESTVPPVTQQTATVIDATTQGVATSAWYTFVQKLSNTFSHMLGFGN